MKTLLKAISFLGLVAIAAPAYSQVGVDLHFGTPAPRREVIVERPYEGAVYTRGAYYYEPRFARYEWRPGFWGRPNEIRREEVRRDDRRDEFRRDDRAHFDAGRGDRETGRTVERGRG